MKLITILALAAASLTSAVSQSSALATVVTLRIPAGHAIPNPALLPASTHATLSSLRRSRNAPLSTAGTFVFRNVTAGSYLVDVHCASFAFVPLRLDVAAAADGDGDQLVVKAWQTFRGNDWDNKGEAVAVAGTGNELEVRVLGGKAYFMQRSTFSVLSILKNPMILLGLVSMGIFIGMPYLVDNMDPEMRAEWEERQKTNPMNGIMGAATGQPGAAGFDLAGMLAGTSKKEDAVSSDAASGSGSGSGKKGEGKKKR